MPGGVAEHHVRVRGRAAVAGPGLVAGPPGGVGPDPHGDPHRDLVQPPAQGLGLADRPGLAGEGQERRLPGVLDVRPAPQHPPAGPVHHAPVPADERLERLLVAVADEPVQEVARRRARRLAGPTTARSE